MYCERCNGIIETDRCPFCKSRRVRNPEPKDPCFLSEQDYISSGILEDVLKQDSIPFLKKGVMGAGLSIKVGPMLERNRFYVLYEQRDKAMTILDGLFFAADGEEKHDE